MVKEKWAKRCTKRKTKKSREPKELIATIRIKIWAVRITKMMKEIEKQNAGWKY